MNDYSIIIILMFAIQIKPDYRVSLQARTKWCALQCTSIGISNTAVKEPAGWGKLVEEY